MIDKTAIIHPKAKIDLNVKIGPFSIIGENVEIEKNTIIQSHVSILGNTKTLKNGGYNIEFNQSWADNPKNKKGYFGDKFQFACEKLWWLRNRGEYKAKIREV